MASVHGHQARDLQPGMMIRHPVTGNRTRVTDVVNIVSDVASPDAAMLTVRVTCDDGTAFDLRPDAPLAPAWADHHHV